MKNSKIFPVQSKCEISKNLRNFSSIWEHHRSHDSYDMKYFQNRLNFYFR